jgi:hypothetical protein
LTQVANSSAFFIAFLNPSALIVLKVLIKLSNSESSTQPTFLLSNFDNSSTSRFFKMSSKLATNLFQLASTASWRRESVFSFLIAAIESPAS